jgi:hypothetical protein
LWLQRERPFFNDQQIGRFQPEIGNGRERQSD